MKLIWKLIITILILFVVVIGLFVSFAFLIDSLEIKLPVSSYPRRHDLGDETFKQIDVYEYNNRERLAIPLDRQDIVNGRARIFPIPTTNPDKVMVDIVRRLPHLRGGQLKWQVNFIMSRLKVKRILNVSQIYTLLQPSTKIVSTNRMKEDKSRFIKEYGVTVYKHLEEEGITTEVLTAQTAEGLYYYLQNKNLDIPEEIIPLFNKYTGKDIAFVGYWKTTESPWNTPDPERVDMLKDALRFFVKTGSVDRLKGINEQGHVRYYNDFSNCVYSFIHEHYLHVFDEKTGEPLIKNNDFFILFEKYMRENPNDFQPIIDYIQLECPRLFGIKEEMLMQKGLIISFPNYKAIYFPLVAINFYKDETTPITIRNIGFVEPKIFTGLEEHIRTEYFFDDDDTSYAVANPNDHGIFTESELRDVFYTRMEISGPSELLDHDLWIYRKATLQNIINWFPNLTSKIWAIIFLALSSFIPGAIAGLIVFKEARHNYWGWLKFALLGLFNCFSVIGLVIATIFWLTKNYYKESYKDKRKIIFIILFSLLFLIVSLLTTMVVSDLSPSLIPRLNSFIRLITK